MPFMKIRTSFPAAVLSIIILELFAAFLLVLGVGHIIYPDVPANVRLAPGEKTAGAVMISIVCGLGVACLLVAIAIARGSFGKEADRHDHTWLFR